MLFWNCKTGFPKEMTMKIYSVKVGVILLCSMSFCSISSAQLVQPDQAQQQPFGQPPAAQQQVMPAQAAPVPQAASAPRPFCPECGTVETVRETERKPEASGLGAIGGALVGGLLGTQVGRGRGTTAATVVGAAGGAYAGNQIERNMAGSGGSAGRYEVIVRFEDGRQTSFNFNELPRWRGGDRVRLVNGLLQQN